ncbi:hypothetical protein HPB47_026295 [Ixodes persulcatus]|uniref:Uncharacterized protein n=1 Tax=Ixodes persulcatus TaxID=34615 RepID=A0AC60PZB0_IXOPE|nr:hypothetical protein HPB47_026295 [Ixodes persulcatus]
MHRYERLAQSSHPSCAQTLHCRLIKKALRYADRLCTFEGARLQSREARCRFWAGKLHRSYDGRALAECGNVPGSQRWVAEGTHLLPGREFIDCVKLRVNAMPNRTRTKRGQGGSKMCRAGCNQPESLGHILQRCHRSDFKRIKRHDNIVEELATRLRRRKWDVRVEPTVRTSEGKRFPDLVVSNKDTQVILDVQVVGLNVSLGDAHRRKVAKYSVPEVLEQVRGSRETNPLVSSVTLSYRGVWASESAQVLADLGLGREDFKVLTVKCLQGGLVCFRVHQQMTTVAYPRVMARLAPQ